LVFAGQFGESVTPFATEMPSGQRIEIWQGVRQVARIEQRGEAPIR